MVRMEKSVVGEPKVVKLVEVVVGTAELLEIEVDTIKPKTQALG